MLDLRAAPDTLPLGWEVRERLIGEKREEPYRFPDGSVATPERIEAALADMRGTLDVEVELLHKISPDAPPSFPLVDASIKFSVQTPPAPFNLDASTLGTAFYRELRPYVELYRNQQGGTPGEVYVTRIVVRERVSRIAPPPPQLPQLPKRAAPTKRPAPPKGYKYTVRYRDRKTGKLVSAAKWERSRAAVKGAAKRTGKKPGAGRYVRHVERQKVKS